VYSCDYQQLVIFALQNCPIAALPIPFFPAPADAPGGCSCNIGQVYIAGQAAKSEQEKCSMNVTAAASANQITPIQATVANEACTCCAASYPVSVYLFLTTNNQDSFSHITSVSTTFAQTSLHHNSPSSTNSLMSVLYHPVSLRWKRWTAVALWDFQPLA